MKRQLKMICAVGIMFLVFMSASYAKTGTTVDYSLHEKNGGHVIVNGKAKELYREFADQEKALKYVKNKYRNQFKKIREQFRLKELSNETWLDYQMVLPGANIEDKAIIEIEKFFDIYENKDKNLRIKQIAMNNSINDFTKRKMMELPFDFNHDKSAFESEVRASGSKIPDINKAIAYAEKHAVNYADQSYYRYFMFRDCTNFVSQILEAGGVKQNVYNSKSRAWWHKREFLAEGVVAHTHSNSWINANKFAHYMGVKKTFYSHYNFSKNIYRGTIIGMDFKQDGDFNHMGFVTKTDNYAAKYGNKTFYDYKVAQHSNNYYAWASWKVNKWADKEGEVIYGIIRYDGTY